MKYKEFKDRIGEIASKYYLNLKVTEDMQKTYLELERDYENNRI